MLRSLPGRARRRLPWRMRHPARWVASLALRGRDRRARADRWPRNRPTAAPAPRAICRSARGSNRWRSARRPRTATTRSAPGPKTATRSTTSSTTTRTRPGAPSSTTKARCSKAGGVGLGIYLDAAPGVAARAVAIQTPTPGFAVQVYVADRIDLSDSLRHLEAAERTRLAGSGRRERARHERRTHPAAPRRRTPSLLPAVDDRAAARQAVGDDRRADALQIGAGAVLSAAAPRLWRGARGRAGRGGRPARG